MDKCKKQTDIDLTASGDCGKCSELDLIRRQDAIDVCNNAIDLWNGQLGCGALIAVKDCILQLPSAEKTGKWIPIAERKPEKHGRYLVSVYDHNRKCLEVGISYFYPEVDEFSSCNAYEDYYWEVTAWMERPEPYQEEKKCRKKKR